MSARVTAIVWSRYPGDGGEFVLALALADQCTDLGEYIAIDLELLAKKTRQTRDTVVAQLRRMAEAGLLEQMEGSKAFRFTPDFIGGAAMQPRAADPEKDAKRAAARGTRITKEWILPEEWAKAALEAYPAWTPAFLKLVTDRFRDYWIAVPGQKGVKLDWEATFRNWCRKEPAVPPMATPGGSGAAGSAGMVSGEWWLSARAIDKKGEELGVQRIDGELWHQWRDRVIRAAGDGPWLSILKPTTNTQGFQSVAAIASQIKKGANSAAA